MNFIFFFPDEMSAGTLSSYGNPHCRTPHLDKLASEGTLFENCFVQNPVCSPSRCSLMTGTYVHNRGHRTLWNLLKQDEPSLFRYLKNAGYQLRWYGKNDLYSKGYLEEICPDIEEKRKEKDSFSITFDSTKNHFSAEEPGFYSFWFENITDNSGGEIPFDQDVEKAIEFLESHKENDPPFFLYLPIDMPHPPYCTVEPFQSMYSPEDLTDTLQDPLNEKPSYEALIRKYRHIEHLPKELFARIYSIYLGACSYVDYLFGRIDDTLDKCGLKEDTVIIFSSDHGDWHGMRKLVEKWPNAMDDELLRVPLIMRIPDGKKGHIVKEQTELFDIMATVLDIAKIPCKHTHFAHSLVPQIHGAKGDPQRFVFSEGGYDTHEPHCFEGFTGRGGINTDHPIASIYAPKQLQQQEHPESVCRTVMIRSLEYKLVCRTSGENEMYDLKNDPLETCNLYQNKQFEHHQRELKNKLLDWYLHTSDTVPWEEDIRNF